MSTRWRLVRRIGEDGTQFLHAQLGVSSKRRRKPWRWVMLLRRSRRRGIVDDHEDEFMI